jgi:hypothetical protein
MRKCFVENREEITHVDFWSTSKADDVNSILIRQRAKTTFGTLKVSPYW